MTNLILHKNDDASVKPWERSNLLTVETSANSTTNMMRGTSTIVGGGMKGNKKIGHHNDQSNYNVMLNPMVESFLSFNIQNTTAVSAA